MQCSFKRNNRSSTASSQRKSLAWSVISRCEECRKRLRYELVNETPSDAYFGCGDGGEDASPDSTLGACACKCRCGCGRDVLIFPEKRSRREPHPRLPQFLFLSTPVLAPPGPEPAPPKKMHRRHAVPPSRASREMAANGDCRANCHSSRSDVSTGRHAEGINFVAELSIALMDRSLCLSAAVSSLSRRITTMKRIACS
jgi:hypothetical protein